MAQTEKKKRSRRQPIQKKTEDVPPPTFLTISKPEDTGTEHHNVLISFVTKQQQYSVPKHPITVSENSTPHDLNEIVSKLLESGNFNGTPPKFDFLVGDVMLHTKLAHKLAQADGTVSREGVIKVEYLEQLPPPTPQDNLAHDDWVCDLHAYNGWLLTGCYDNSIHIWRPKRVTQRKETDLSEDKSAHRIKIPKAHRAGVKAVSWLPKSSNMFVSGSIDQSVLVWQWNNTSNNVRCVYRCRGHTGTVECVSACADGSLFTTGSWDGEMRLWATDSRGDMDVDDDEPVSKKSKSGNNLTNKSPLTVVKDHTQVVSGMVWATLTTLVTCSYDHSVRLWDMEEDMKQFKSYVAPCSVVSVDSSPFDNTLLVTTIDKHVRLLDPRDDNLQLVKTYKHHKRFATRVKWSPSNECHFATSGTDRIVKLWDIRSPNAPLYEMLSHKDKVLALDWCKSGVIFSGGADCNVKMFSYS